MDISFIDGACVVCGIEECVVVYPLLPGEPKFCREHYTREFAEPYGVDFSPSDNIPDGDPFDEEEYG